MPSRIVHPYTGLTGGAWLRGNLHTHTRQSDGSRPPQAVIDDYATRGYGFLMLSDHDVFTSDATLAQWDSRGMVLIPGNEIAGGPHLLHVDAERHVAQRESRQEILNDILAAARESGRGFAIINHPNWGAQFNHAGIAQLREWTGYAGLEIYNGVIAFLDGSPYATDKWDILLNEGRRVWGFANDDAHRPEHVAWGWNVAYVTERTRAGVVEALRTGRFYPSTGVTITGIHVDGMTIRLETADARRICAYRNAGRFAWTDGNAMELTVPPGARYVRFECWGDGERFAWTQPFYIEDDAGADREALPFLTQWQVSPLQEHGTLATASPAQADELKTVPVQAHPAGHRAAGFVNVQPQIAGRGGLVYLRADFPAARAGRAVLKLGYDGPVRAWVNGREVFAGPGTNPALPDQVAVYADVQEGPNTLLIALDSHHGKAWGVYARVEEEATAS